MKITSGRRRTLSVVYVYAFLVVAFAAMSIAFPLFISNRNLTNILIQIAPLAIVSIGQAIVIIGGGVDLTVGSVVSLTTVLAANIMEPSLSGILFGLVLIFLSSALVGFVNGLICNETNIPPLIVTLCTSSIIQGIILWYRDSPGGKVPKTLCSVIMYKFNVISVPILIVLILYGAFIIIMARSKFGLYTYSIGDNEEYARMAGINIKSVRIKNYIVSSLLASIAGLVVASRIRSGSPIVGNPYQLDSLTAVLVGGTPFTGGQGTIVGAFAGASIISIIRNALNISGVSPFYQYFAKGALLIIALIVSSYGEWRK